VRELNREDGERNVLMLVNHVRNEDGRDKMAKRSAKAKKKRRGRASYRKGEEFEKKAYPFLREKGFKVTKSRVRSRTRSEFDGLATDKQGRTYGIETKGTKQKVTSTTVRKLKEKVYKHKLLRGGIIVSKKGYTKPALEEAKKSGIKTYKYKRKRKKENWFW
jgi:HJR/Mrr/RecB family endonuclease